MKKFTFKKEPRETGLAGVGRPWPDTVIKYNKKEVGLIVAPIWSSKTNDWKIRLKVSDENSESKLRRWKWILLKATFPSEPEARKFINENVVGLLKKNLYMSDEDE